MASSVSHDAQAAQLDAEIASLKDQLKTYRTQARLLSQTVLGSARISDAPPAAADAPDATQSSTSALITAQRHDHLSTLYRACAGITTFQVRDPDPCAVDAGRVLGVRIDVAQRGGRFMRPYYVLLNRVTNGASQFRVHKHTCPPCIPVEELAARYLRTGEGATTRVAGGHGDASTGAGMKRAARPEAQDITSFVRAVRRALIAYHHRLQSVKHVRRQLGLEEGRARTSKQPGHAEDHGHDDHDDNRDIIDVSAVDAEARQIKMEWRDGRVGRVLINDAGEVIKSVVIDAEGKRDSSMEETILGRHGRIETLAERLLEGVD